MFDLVSLLFIRTRTFFLFLFIRSFFQSIFLITLLFLFFWQILNHGQFFFNFQIFAFDNTWVGFWLFIRVRIVNELLFGIAVLIFVIILLIESLLLLLFIVLISATILRLLSLLTTTSSSLKKIKKWNKKGKIAYLVVKLLLIVVFHLLLFISIWIISLVITGFPIVNLTRLSFFRLNVFFWLFF